MDIFTTQLAQSSPTVTAPINPAKLKVKALVKYARKGKLKADKRELEKEEYGFYHPKDNGGSNSQQQNGYFAAQEVVQLSDEALDLEKRNQVNTKTVASVDKKRVKNKNEVSTDHSKKIDHLDIFI